MSSSTPLILQNCSTIYNCAYVAPLPLSPDKVCYRSTSRVTAKLQPYKTLTLRVLTCIISDGVPEIRLSAY